MIEVYGDLWTYPADIRIITTNGTVTKKGLAVMGRGCAKEAAGLFPGLPERLGCLLQRKGGNVPHVFDEFNLITFPVKHNWWELGNLPLIHSSCLQLLNLIDPGKIYVMARPGTGNGRLEWGAVKSIVKVLPDNVHIIDYEKENQEVLSS